MKNLPSTLKGAALAVFALALAACSDSGTTPPVILEVSPADLTLEVGQSETLTVTVTGSEAVPAFSTANGQVAAVHPMTGRVTGVSVGETTVTVTAEQATLDVHVSVLPPSDPVIVTLNPSAAALVIGAELQIVATVLNADDEGVTWASSDEAVAEVSSSGRVSGLGQGVAIITATSVADPAAKAEAEITVTPDPQGQASVSIASVTSGNDPVDPENVSGVVNVNLNLEIPTTYTGDLEVLFGDQVVGTQSFVAGAAMAPSQDQAATVSITVNTAKFGAITAEPALLNGDYTVVARLTSSTGGVVTATGQTLTLTNPDAVLATWSTDRGSAINPATGQTWHGGGLGVDLTGVMYSGGQLSNVGIGLMDGATLVAEQMDAAESGNFTLFFSDEELPAQGGSAGLDGTFSLQITSSALVGGGDGPTGFAVPVAPVRLDNVAPSVPAFEIGHYVDTAPFAWVNAAYRFVPESLDGFAADTGVGGVTCTAYAGDASEDSGSWNDVQIGDDLPSSSTNTEYGAKVRCEDRLGNLTERYLDDGLGTPITFGVDKAAPTIGWDAAGVDAEEVFVTDGAVEFRVERNDLGPSGPSGFGTNAVRWLGSRLAYQVSPADACLSTWDGASCSPEAGEVGMDPEFSVNGEGYYTFHAYVLDRAQNASDTIERTVLYDETPPSVTPANVPSQITAGQSVTFTATAADNLDLGAYQMLVEYGDGKRIHLQTAPSTLSWGFTGTLLTSSEVSRVWQAPILGLQEVLGGAPQAPAANAATGVGIVIEDVAGNWDDSSAAIGAAVTDPMHDFRETWGPGPENTAFLMTQPADNGVCSAFAASACPEFGGQPVPTSIELEVSVTRSSSETSSPFDQVRFYRQNADDYRPLAGAVSQEVSDDGTTRTFTYRMTWTAPAGLTAGPQDVVAIGVSDTGAGLISSFASLEVFTP